MTSELYEEVKDVIPKHIGVYMGSYCKKKAKKQELQVDEQVLKNSMIRSLSREFAKQYKSGNPTIVEGLNRRIRRIESEKTSYRSQYYDLLRKVQNKYGTRWDKDDKD